MLYRVFIILLFGQPVLSIFSTLILSVHSGDGSYIVAGCLIYKFGSCGPFQNIRCIKKDYHEISLVCICYGIDLIRSFDICRFWTVWQYC